MLARVWWKEWRQSRAALIGLVGVAAGIHGLAIYYEGPDASTGVMTPIVLGMVILYVVATGAAAFAGEREVGTLRFLDILPVDRRALWLGKVTYLFGTSLALTTVMYTLSRLGVTRPAPQFDLGHAGPIFSVVFTGAAAWSLFWSAISGDALNAAILALGTLGAIGLGTSGLIDPGWWAATHLALSCGALVGSRSVMMRRPRAIRSLQSLARAVQPPVDESRPIRPTRATSIRSLAWQTYRAGRQSWLLLMGVGIVIFFLSWINAGRSGHELTSLSILMSLEAGVCVFGTENQGKTHRFLVQRGVRPGQVWAVKQLIWAGAMLPIGLLSLAMALFVGSLKMLPFQPFSQFDNAIAVLSIPALGFALAQLCGMAFRRRITAAAIATLIFFLLDVPLMGLFLMGMIPAWSLLLPPAILLMASWAWCRDWMADRPGPGRWLRLGLLTVLPFGMLGLLYIGGRAWGMPDVELPFDVEAVRSATVAPSENAAEVYRGAFQQLRPHPDRLDHRSIKTTIEQIIDEGWDPDQEDVSRWLRENQDALALAHRAAQFPQAQFQRVGDRDIFSEYDRTSREMADLGLLIAVDARQRMFQDDLSGAWADIRLLLVMFGHLETSASTIQLVTALTIHHRAMQLGMAWSADPRQTRDALRAALVDLRRLPMPPSMVGTLQVNYALLDRTLDLPTVQLLDRLDIRSGPASLAPKLIMTPPWERVRAHRVIRHLAVEEILRAKLEPWKRRELRGVETWGRSNFPYNQGISLLASRLWPSTDLLQEAIDQEVVWRRALEQILALRSWQLRHDGAYPETLAELVPSELSSLPTDPFSGRPFGWHRSEGQSLLSLGHRVFHNSVSKRDEDLRPTRPGQRLLSSVGPDGLDNQGRIPLLYAWSQGPGDIVFPLPDVPPTGPGRGSPDPK